MKSAAVAIAVVGFSVLVAHLVETGRASVPRNVDARPIQFFSADQSAWTFHQDGSAVRTAITRYELEHYDATERQRKIDKAIGRNYPHGTYTVPSGLKCKVLSQHGAFVEVMWQEGEVIQREAWVDARDLRKDKP